MSTDYPRQLYRLGSQESVWGVKCDLLRVDSADEEAGAKADGWSTAFELAASLEDKPAAEPATTQRKAAKAVKET